MSNPTKEELFAYAYKKAGAVNSSGEGKYLHRNIYKAFVCPPISDGIATTYEDVDKLIEESISTNPKSTEDQMYDLLIEEHKQKEKECIDWFNQLNEDELKLIKEAINYLKDTNFLVMNKINDL